MDHVERVAWNQHRHLVRKR